MSSSRAKSELEVGIVGCGHIAPTHLNAWQRDGHFRVRGVFDLDATAAERLAARAPHVKVYGSVEELVAGVDVVDICTPPSTHFSLLQQALAAGRHIVIEKPLVPKEEEWHTLAGQVDQHPGSLSVVHHMKFTRAVQTAKRWLGEGRLGRLLRIESYFATHPDTDRMLTVEPHWSHGLPGGRWFETLPHNLYLTHHFAGPLELDHVTAARTEAAPAGASADEVTVVMSGGGSVGVIHFSANCRHNYRWATLVGSEAVVRLDLLSGALALDRIADRPASRASGRLFLQSLAALVRSPIDRFGYAADRLRGLSPHARFVESLGSHLFAGTDPPTPLEEIEFTVDKSFEIGQAIDAQLSSR